jgi:uncharacterized membrane protein
MLVVARLAFLGIPVWIALDMLLSAAGPAWLYAAFDLPFNVLCHRLPERTLSLAGVAMPLCSRCAGLYLGLSLGAAMAWPELSGRALRVVVPLSAALLVLEVITQDLGLHPVFHPTRVLSGLLVSVPLGGALGAVIKRNAGAHERGGDGA